MHYIEPHGFYVEADRLPYDDIARVHLDGLHAYPEQPIAEHGRDWDPELGHTTSTDGCW